MLPRSDVGRSQDLEHDRLHVHGHIYDWLGQAHHTGLLLTLVSYASGEVLNGDIANDPALVLHQEPIVSDDLSNDAGPGALVYIG